MKKRILLVDNLIEFAETWAGILKDNGYETTIATSAEGADDILARTWFHLMIIDVRLRDESDRKDTSGLLFAKKEEYRYVNKVILTQYSHYEVVREAMRVKGGVAPAVDYLDKEEGKEGLLRVVSEAFKNDIIVNWKLEIGFNEQSPVSFLRLAELIEPGLDPALLPERARELKDLFCRLFLRERQVRIDSVLWQGGGRVALRALTFAGRSESFVVVCGPQKVMAREAEQFRDCSNNAANGQGTMLNGSAINMRFAANAYLLAGADLENVRSLTELYRGGPEKAFNKALESLFQETLAPCLNEKYLSDEWDSIAKLCRTRFGLADLTDNPEEFEKRLRVIAAQAPRLNTEIEFAPGKLTFHFGSQSFSYPDPINALRRDFEFPLLVNAPLLSSGERILTDGSGMVWLTDFIGAGPMPLLWNFTALEAMIRFDWIEAAKPQWLHELEKCLVADFTRFDMSDLESPLRQPARAIQAVRKLAGGVVDDDRSIYHWGLLFEAMRRLASFNPASPLTKNELARLLHILIAAAVISGKLSQPAPRAKSPADGIRVDKENRIVLVRGQRVRMRGLGYDLLCLLSERRGQLYSPREIVEQVFKEDYRENDNYQNNRLYVAVSRLRKMIEDDPDNPRFLLNEPGGGYRLAAESE